MKTRKFLETLAEKVELTLINQPIARTDDFILIFLIWTFYIQPDATLEDVMVHHLEHEIPTPESITRCRRKIQAIHPELVDTFTDEQRRQLETEFKSFFKK